LFSYVRPAMRGSVILFVFTGLLACSRTNDDKPSATTASPPGPGSGSGSLRKQQVEPPFDLKAPPPDATKTESGLIYKKIAVNASGVKPKRNDTVLIHYTGWRQATGETFFTNQGRGQPMPLNLSQTAPGFTEALQQVRTGEKAVLWMPPSIGYKKPPTSGQPETLVYLVEVVDVQAAPNIPDDVAKPPDKATALKLGIKTVVVRPGTGKDAIRQFDTVSYSWTAWDPDGRMLDSNETFGKKPTAIAVFKQSDGLIEMLTSMTVGARARFWLDAEKVSGAGGKPPGGLDHGPVCYEIEITQVTKPEHDPPPSPPDVAKPPADAKKTAKGVFYKVLAAGPGRDPRHPSPTDQVKVNYTGWTTDGHMFDSSYLRPDAAIFGLKGVVAGWTDGVQLMTAGDRYRFWIPEELAYKGQQGKPKGMLVFDIELIEIMTPSAH
jgi:FKBP-type peptidyl-prolyl cis-trans isomerase